MGSKGLSPMIAMILLVVITIVSAGAMAMWAKQYIGEKTQNATSQDRSLSRCLRTGIDVLTHSYDSSSNSVTLVIENSQFEPVTQLGIQFLSNSGIYKISDANLTEGKLESTINPSDIVMLKVDASNMNSDNYTVRIVPNDCPQAVRTVNVEII